MARVYLGVGANLQPERHIAMGLNELRRRFGELTISSIYRCKAVGFDGPDFLNLAVGLTTELSPAKLVDALHDIEDAEGRTRSGPRFADRTLDMDLLLYDDLVLRRGNLRLPRGEILEQAFVLKPLAEIAPEVMHPIEKQTIAELWAAFPQPEDDVVPIS